MKTETQEIIRELAEKLGTTVEHIYEVLTKQARVWAFQAIIKSLLWVVLLVGLIVITCHQHYVPSTNEMFVTWETFFLIVCSIATFVISVIIASCASETLGDIYTAITNPEWFSVDTILSYAR